LLGALSVAGAMLVGAPATAQPVLDGAALERMKVRLDGTAGVPAEVAGWYADADERVLVLRAVPGGAEAARRFAVANGVPETAVRVEDVPGRAQRQSDRLDAGAGFQIGGNATCSAGFAVTEDAGGNAGFTTAGHCAVGGALTKQGRPLGAWGDYSYPTEDMAWVRTTADWRPTAEARGLGPINGHEPATEDTTVCHSGDRTGVHCGTILAKNVTIVYTDSNGGPSTTVTGLTMTDACAEKGDSGGPVVVGDQAQGVISGSDTRTCAQGDDRTYFQPIIPILSAYDLTLRRYWQSWTEVPGGQEITSSPAVATYGNYEYVFARRTDGKIVYAYRSGSNWSIWYPLSGDRTTPSAPAVTVHNGMLVVFMHDGAGRLFYRTLTAWGWSGWTDVPGGRTSPSAPAAAVVNGELHLIVRATDSTLVENVYRTTGWSGWTPVSGNGSTPDAPAVTEYNGTLRMAVRAIDGRVYLTTYTAGAWGGWIPVPGNGWTTSPLGLTTYDGRLRLFARGGNNHLFTIAYDGTTFDRWTELTGSGATPSGPALNVYDGDFHLYVRGMDNKVWVNTARV
jgi:hypothetical protein